MVNEIELGSSEIEIEENPYVNQTGFSEENQKKVAMIRQGTSAVSNGKDLQEVIQENEPKSVDEIQNQESEEYVNSRTNQITDVVEQVAVEAPELLPEVVVNSQEQLSEAHRLGTTKLAPMLAWVESMEGTEKMTLSEKKDIAADLLLMSPFAESLDKKSFLGSASNIIGMLALPDETFNSSELLTSLLGESQSITDYLEGPEALGHIAGFRNSLDPEERVLFDESLIRAVVDMDDNEHQQLIAVMEIIAGGEEAEFWQRVEQGTILLGAISGIPKVLKGLKSVNTLRNVAKAKDARTAAKISDEVSAKEEVSVALGVTQADAASTGNPVRPEGVFTGAPSGLQQEYRFFMGDVTEALDRASDTLNITALEGTKDADIIAAAVKKNLNKNDEIDNFEFKEIPEGISVKYDVISPEGTTTVTEEKVLTLDDVEGFVQDETGLVGAGARFFISPNTLAGKDRKLFVQDAEALSHSKARTGKALSDAVDAAFKPVNGNKKSLAKLNDLFKVLDGTSTENTYQKLVVEGVGGVRLTDKEFLAFTGVRRVLDDTWFQNNLVVRREMELKGIKSLDYDGDIKYAKEYKDPDAAYRSYSGDVQNQHIVDVDGNLIKGAGLDVIKDKYQNGQVLVRIDGSDQRQWFDSSEGFVRYALVNTGDVQNLPRIVLNKVKNYLPKLREDANFFIKKKTTLKVNGKNIPSESTLAYAATEAQSLAYIDKLRKTAIDAGEEFVDSDYLVKFDREITRASNGEEATAISGGLIRGKRKSTELEWAGDYGEGGRTDMLESIQRYLGVTADRIAMNEWRLEARANVIKSASLVDDIGDSIKGVPWKEARSVIENSGASAQRKAKLLGMYDQVSVMSNIPTKSESAFQGFVKTVGMQIDKANISVPFTNKKLPTQGAAKYLYKMHDKSIFDLAKSTTYNLTLGMFSLAQIPVQISGATIALSINPVSAIKGMPRWLMASTLDFATDEKVAKQFMAKVSKDHGIDAKTLENDYSAWRRSGMYEAVVRGNADAASVSNRLPYDANVISKGFHKFVDLGQTPYRIGELGNMRISFFTALEREKDLLGKNFKYDDQTITRVVARAEQYRLNMSPANKAAFQKGIWGVPTQFKQIYTKYLEAIAFKSHFTPAERVRLVVGQGILFGAAGVPILNYTWESIADNVFNMNAENTSAEHLILANRGAMGWALNYKMDMDALISGRLTVNADIMSEVNSMFFDTKTPMIKSMLGATYLTGDKILDLFSNMTMVGGLVIDDYLNEEELDPALRNAVGILAESTLNLASSGRKWVAAYDLSQGIVRKSDGSPLYSVHPEIEDIIIRSVGFGSQETDDLYKLSIADRESQQMVNDLTTQFLHIVYTMQQAVDNGDESIVEASQIAATFVRRHIDSLGPELATKVNRNFINRLNNAKDFKEKTLSRALTEMYGTATSSANEVSIIKRQEIERRGLDAR